MRPKKGEQRPGGHENCRSEKVHEGNVHWGAEHVKAGNFVQVGGSIVDDDGVVERPADLGDDRRVERLCADDRLPGGFV